MRKIHYLSPEIIAKIAAGEVIERPSFAVKELIENSLDAHATEIEIIVEDAGLKRIQIIDNGEGMNKEDLEACWELHTTSKLSDIDSLHGIKTLGFRGEALASLSSVSTLTIKSRPRDKQIGNEIQVKDGTLIKSIPCGMPQGTTIIVENLFSQIPARRKFLKSSLTEFRHIVDVVSSFVIAYPKIQFTLKHNNKTILSFHHNVSKQTRIQGVIGEKISPFLIPLKHDSSYLSLEGYIAKPQISSTTQSKQLLFVNKRKVTDRIISLAVKEAFGTMLESNTYPVFTLFLTLPYEMIDINIHPRKEHVAFLNNQFIFQAVKEAVTELLQNNNITFQNLSWKRMGVGTTKSFAGQMLKEVVLNKQESLFGTTISPQQIHRLYILSQSKDGVIITDQHAAHERILFERLVKEFLKQKKKIKNIQLKDPAVLHLIPREQILLKEFNHILKKIGFIITLKNETAIVTHMPFLFQDRDPSDIIKQIIENIEDGIPLRKIDKISEEMMAFLACRAAVKSGDTLEDYQMEKILQDLTKTPHNTTCPHGRPTRIVISLNELNHLFKR